MRRLHLARLFCVATLAAVAAWSAPLLGFCGFYVAKADTKLFNKASQVVLVRDGDRTVMTMANDFKGELQEFAVVIPVPTFLERGQIHVGDKALVNHLDAYSAPRLVEYFDQNPCWVASDMVMSAASPRQETAMRRDAERTRSLGVTIEARYTVGEYDILILSAQQSSGLETWLRENGYRIPPGASEVLSSYLKQNMRFFVAKVNLAEQTKLGFSYLRPLQVAYESPKFMLPIRLGMVNADGPQELFVYALTRKGRIETTNYRTVKIPSNLDLPEYEKDPSEFTAFYKAMFSHQVDSEGGRVFVEYAWDTRWCDPCAAEPLSTDELRRLGVFWNDGVFVTRLHVRYDKAHFPEDLVFQETADHENFQGRYVIRHAWTGDLQGPRPMASCPAADAYRAALGPRREREAQQLASLTGWNLEQIRRKMNLGSAPQSPAKWWEQLWKR